MADVKLEPVKTLFDPETPFTKEDFLPAIISNLKQTKFPGVSEEHLEITSQEGDPSAIMVRKVDPFSATGYLAFQSEHEYSDWLQVSLYEPTQDEIVEALDRGTRT